MDIITLALAKKQIGKDTTKAVSDYLDEHLTNPTNPPLDTSLSIAGAAADSKAAGDKLSELKEGLNDIIKDVNTSSLWEQGGISSSNGTNSTGTNRLRTVGYVESNLMIVPANGYKYIICAYDTSGYVGMWDGSGFVKSATWLESKINLSNLGDYSFRLVFSKTTNATIDVAESSNIALLSLTDLTLTQKGRPADAQITGNTINAVKAKTDSLFADFNNLSPTLDYSGYINSGTGAVSSSEYAKCTDFVDIGDYNTIDWNSAGGNSSVARVAFYNSEKTFLSAINTGTSGTVDLTDEAYTSVKYVRFSYYDYPNKVFSNFAGVLYKKDSVKSKIDTLQLVTGTYKPSNVLIFGDSITDCASFTIVDDKTTAYSMFGTNSYVNAGGDTVLYKMWPKIFGQYVPCAEIRNYARSGASYKDQTSPDNPRRNLSYQITLALNDLPNENGAFVVNNFVPDVIIFALGTNDGQPNDTPADAYAKIVTTETGFDIDATLAALDRTKFCEAVLWAYFITRKHFPFALTLCVLPTQRMSDDYPIGNARTYLIEIAQKYGGAVLVDGAFSSGIVKENNVRSGLGATLKDGLHPNDKGQNLMARLIIGAFKQYYVPFDDMNP